MILVATTVTFLGVRQEHMPEIAALAARLGLLMLAEALSPMTSPYIEQVMDWKGKEAKELVRPFHASGVFTIADLSKLRVRDLWMITAPHQHLGVAKFCNFIQVMRCCGIGFIDWKNLGAKGPTVREGFGSQPHQYIPYFILELELEALLYLTEGDLKALPRMAEGRVARVVAELSKLGFSLAK